MLLINYRPSERSDFLASSLSRREVRAADMVTFEHVLRMRRDLSGEELSQAIEYSDSFKEDYRYDQLWDAISIVLERDQTGVFT